MGLQRPIQPTPSVPAAAEVGGLRELPHFWGAEGRAGVSAGCRQLPITLLILSCSTVFCCPVLYPNLFCVS